MRVIGVLLSMLSMSEGLHSAYLNTGDPREVFVISAGALYEAAGSISRDKARTIMDTPGIARAPDGSAIAEPGLEGEPAGSLAQERRQGEDRSQGHGPQGRDAASRIPSGERPHVPARQP